MTDAASPTAEDIAYVRRLAEAGARAPLLSGRFLAWWGLALTVAYGAHHFALSGALGAGGGVFWTIWATFAVVGVAGQILLARNMPAKAGAGSAGNRASRSVWIAAGTAIFAVVVGAAAAVAGGASPALFDMSVPVAFAVYACALVVTGSLSGDRIVLAAGGGAILMAGLFTALIVAPERYLIAAGGIALTVLLPGLLLLGREPRAG